MKRYALGLMVAMALLALPANGAGAQADAGCDTLSAAEAQTLLDSQPTYANRDLLDPDRDGVACEPDELAATAPAEGCDPAGMATGATDATDDADGAADASGADDPAADADADAAGADDAASGGAADVADPCDPATARGGSGNGVTVNGLPSTGAGVVNPAGLVALLAAASALGGVGAAAASRLRARA